MPVMQYLGEDQDERGRGTAVFALGEIGSDKAVPLLNAVVAQDQSPMVRRLAKEALQKVSGEMPTERAKTVACEHEQGEPADRSETRQAARDGQKDGRTWSADPALSRPLFHGRG